jgi:hypothetical protein
VLRLGSAIGLTCALVGYVAAEPPAPVPGKVMNPAPKIDGNIQSDEWRDVPSFSGLREWNGGTLVAESGTFWLAYDENFIYFAARLEDPQPQRISADEYRTNVGLGGNDAIFLRLDPFGNLNDFSTFGMNPRGATSVNIAGGRAPKREWLGEFQAAGRITDQGWEVEARIPWSIMRLPKAGTNELRFNVFRQNQRLQTETVWGWTANGQVENFGRWQNVQIPPTAETPFRLLPYAYLGANKRGRLVANAGLDMRKSLGELDVVGTINPDFRNIESQILSLDFSYTERLQGEVRPFFLEGRDFFSTSFDAPIFVSQRIGEFDGGLKLFGKTSDRTNLGFLSTHDFGDTRSTVARIQQRLSDRSSLSFAMADLDSTREDNEAYYLGAFQEIGPYGLYANFSRTVDKRDGTGFRNNIGSYYGYKGNFTSFDISEISPGFSPKLGFVGFRGIRSIGMDYGREFQPKRGPFLEVGWFAFGNHTEKWGGGVFSRTLGVGTGLTWRNGLDIDTNVRFVEIEGNKDARYRISIEMPRSNPYRNWELNYTAGVVRNQYFEIAEASASYRPIQRLQLTASAANLRHFENSTQVIIGANYDLGRDQSISGRMVREDRDLNAYLAYRRSGNKGVEYFLIVGDPNTRNWTPSITLKVTVPFNL